jgi:hypothetical protein
VVAEDSLLMREGISQVIDRQPDLDVVGSCADLLSRQITESFPSVRVISPVDVSGRDLPADALSCGAPACVRKQDRTPKVLRESCLLPERDQSRSASFAAWKPPIPCTPPPGGVLDEQM